MERQIEKFELSNQQSNSTERESYYGISAKFNATAEGCLIEYLKIHKSSTLSELENHIEANISSLRNYKGKKYVQTPEQVTRSTLIRNRRIFTVESEKWSIIARNLEEFENEQNALIFNYSKKKLEKQKQREEEEAQYTVLKSLLKLEKVLGDENNENENFRKAIDEAYTKLANNS
ncbi:unnamed protein product [Blepharisma stoltei]|uniref:Uncharacterized protein n=1 Tax=Blepharisma stoltei TaxID=1481888 RepID=A0AAU9JT97_9CILI|nr:unnamed protein product [Blepharisma stoltei]